MPPSISCSNPKTFGNRNLQDELCNRWVFVLLVDKSGEWRTLFETAVASTYANTTLVFLHSVLQWATTPCCAVLSAHHICWCTSQCPTTTLTVLLCWVLPRCATQLQPHLFSQQQNPLVSESLHRDTAVRTGDFLFLLLLFKYLFLQKSEDNCETRAHFWFSRHCYVCCWQDEEWEHPSHLCVRSGKKR